MYICFSVCVCHVTSRDLQGWLRWWVSQPDISMQTNSSGRTWHSPPSTKTVFRALFKFTRSLLDTTWWTYYSPIGVSRQNKLPDGQLSKFSMSPFSPLLDSSTSTLWDLPGHCKCSQVPNREIKYYGNIPTFLNTVHWRCWINWYHKQKHRD